MGAEKRAAPPQKRMLGVTVLEAAEQRIRRVFDDFPKIYISFSAGKDSGTMLDLVCREARARGRKVGVLLVDLEGQYKLTIDYALETIARWADVVDPYWVALPLNLRNAVSQFEPQWMCWDPDRRRDWIREPPEIAITDESFFPFFRRRMEFEEFVPAFGEWYSRDGVEGAEGKLTACFVGIRTQESLNRWRSIARRDKNPYEGLRWTTWVTGNVFNAYPIYDWRTEDIWRYNAKRKVPYNRLYDRMHQAGLTIHQARICQPYGDDQRRGLWLFHVIEPETWARVVARVNGANWGAAQANSTGNALGRIKITKPDDITWEEFARRLLESMPGPIAEHYRDKISVFIHWYETNRGYEGGIIDDDGPTDKGSANWKRICKVLLVNDFNCKRLSFSPHRTGAYDKYRALMKKRRDRWGYDI
jgi:predicted phosphoadenosine phosphosulfate sulfurtransferase